MLAISIATLLTARCSTSNILDTNIKTGGEANNAVTAQAKELKKCAKPLGVAVLVEPESSKNPYAVLTQHNLPSPIPMIKLMMAKSNCFQVVDRGAASKALERERALASAGELVSNKNTASGNMISADWIITPSIIFSDNNAGGSNLALGGLLAGFLGPIGALAGNINISDKEVQTLLTAVNVRTGLQDAVAEGRAKKTDVGFGVGGGSYGSTDMGKIVVAAFLDAHNKLVEQMSK
ncbi:peptidoglycan-binding domain 1 protein [Isorropodon fossajaponicum endosymbiont JTNG4]|nr:peptidoglycan-binding domain 1 protein [Isorropodon fossajaponicum endosymbiont JTNG4]